MALSIFRGRLLMGFWVVIGLVAGGGRAMGQSGPSAPFVSWITGLSPATYTVTAGSAAPINCSLSASTGPVLTYLGSCFGNNTASPYAIIAPPPPSGSYGLPSYLEQNFNIGTSTAPDYEFYQLANNEAIVTIITLPPPAAYYSFQTYLFQRPAIDYYPYTAVPAGTGEPSGTTNCKPSDPYPITQRNGAVLKHSLTWDCNYNIFGYFGNTVNNTDVLSQTGLEFNSASGNPTAAIAIITTANPQVFQMLQASFDSAPNLNANWLFLDRMPSGGSTPLLNTGTASGSDVFGAIFRLTEAQNQTAGGSWNANAASNMLVYRVAIPGVSQTNLYSSSNLLSPTYNTNEVTNVTTDCPALGSNPSSQTYYCDIQELGALLQDYLGTVGVSTQNYSLVDTASAAAFPGATTTNGPFCIQYGIPCVGGTQDTYAYSSQTIGKLNTGAPAFFIGVDHASSTSDSTNPVNNSVYTGLSTNISAQNIGVTDVIETNVAATFSLSSVTPQPPTNYLEGSGVSVVSALSNDSSLPYPPSAALTKDAQNLYVAAVVRLSSSGGCMQSAAFFCGASYPFATYISSDSGTLTYIPTADTVLLTERAYLLPATSSPPPPETGANASYLQPPYVLYNTAN